MASPNPPGQNTDPSRLNPDENATMPKSRGLRKCDVRIKTPKPATRGISAFNAAHAVARAALAV